MISPKDCIDNVVPLFDGEVENGSYSIAEITWKGKVCIGLRWNVNEREWDNNEKSSGKVTCVGEPNSRGFPTWFILPNDFLEAMLSEKDEIANKIKEVLKRIE